MPGGCCCFICVATSNVGIVERFGQFDHLAKPGLTCICWPIYDVVADISTRVQQLDVRVETKTKDNVFIYITISVQYSVLYEKVYDAHYRLTDPHGQIRAYIFDVVRSTLPKLDLDEAFEAKTELAHAVRDQLAAVMAEYGYQILQALVTDIDPDQKVKDAMNEINSSKRLREAATHKAEADKVMQVKSAEAEAEAKYLGGVGVSRQRQAIVTGLKDSILDFGKGVPGTTPQDVMSLMMLTQYFDMLRDIGQHSKTSTVFLPHAPDAVQALQAAIRDGLMQGAVAAQPALPMTR